MKKENIRIQRLQVGFQNKMGFVPALKNISLEIEAQRCTGILGESGSGKSVLAMALLDLLPPYALKEEEIWVGSQKIETLRRKKTFHGEDFAFIPQNPGEALSPSMMIDKQFQHTMNKKNYLGTAQNLLTRLGFSKPENILKTYPHELSGGMLQRVLAGLSMSKFPTWLIADEPTKGVDEKTLALCYQLFERLRTEYQVSLLVITHDIHFAKHLCDDIVIMYDGQVVEHGQEVLEYPYHPYTQGFIQSLPEHGFQPMQGMAPGPYDIVSGCSFYARCPYRKERCLSSVPALYEYKNRKVKCFLYDKTD